MALLTNGVIRRMKCFRRNYHKPSREYGSHGEGEAFKPLWGYLVPHTENAQGATTIDKKWSEYSYGQSVATQLGLPWDDRNSGGVRGGVERLVNGKKINAVFEDHKNAYNNRAEGFEILILKGDILSKRYAEMIVAEFESTYPKRRNRGIKEMTKGGRGYNNLLNHKKGGAEVALLGEMFFIDNPKEWITPQEYVKFLKAVLV